MRWKLVTAGAAWALASLWTAFSQATVEEQRARLPPPQECEDPVAGIWRAHHFRPKYREWYIYLLEVRRVSPGSPQLTGTMSSEFWNGGKDLEQPPPCTPPRLHAKVRMPSRGEAVGEHIRFDATSWEELGEPCGKLHIAYNLDHFSGDIDPKLQEFQSVNNDGGSAVNEPMVFRRVHCWEEPKPPRLKVTVTPPPLVPAHRDRGCGSPF